MENEKEEMQETLPAGYYQEREIVKLLLLYGRKVMTDFYGRDCCVAQVIVDFIENTQLYFSDKNNSNIYDVFKYLLFVRYIPDGRELLEIPTLHQTVSELLESPYKLDELGKYGIIINDEDKKILSNNVLSSLLRYFDLVVSDRMKYLDEVYDETEDEEEKNKLVMNYDILRFMRIKLNKALGIMIAK